MSYTRPDFAFAISLEYIYVKSRYKHWMVMKYLLIYLLGSKHLGLIYGKYENESEVKGFVDSDYASNKDNRKSTTPYYLHGLVIPYLGSFICT